MANEIVVALKNYLRQLDTDMANEKRAYYAKQISIIRQTMPQLEIEYKNAEKKKNYEVFLKGEKKIKMTINLKRKKNHYH